MKSRQALRVLRNDVRGFPRRNAGASLKWFPLESSEGLHRPFPPQKCGGLIEVARLTMALGSFSWFPPQKCGGLIEVVATVRIATRIGLVSPAEMRGPH